MKLTLAQTIQETHDARSFIFEPAEDLQWRAGQFLHLWLPHSPADDRQTDRYFTIASAPHERQVRITTRFAGQGGSSFKHALEELPIGATVEAAELDGDFVVERPDRWQIFIAGGIGITPFRAMLLDLEHRALPLNATLLYSNRDSDFVYAGELEALAKKHPEFEVQRFVSPRRIDRQAILEHAARWEDPIFFVSGPEPMVESMGALLREELGVPDERLKQDWFPNYEAEEDELPQHGAAATGQPVQAV